MIYWAENHPASHARGGARGARLHPRVHAVEGGAAAGARASHRPGERAGPSAGPFLWRTTDPGLHGSGSVPSFSSPFGPVRPGSARFRRSQHGVLRHPEAHLLQGEYRLPIDLRALCRSWRLSGARAHPGWRGVSPSACVRVWTTAEPGDRELIIDYWSEPPQNCGLL